MKTQKNKLMRCLMAIAFFLCMIMTVAPSTRAQAAKITNKKAQKILKKEVKNKYCQYAFLDIDNDKIDELIVVGYSGKFKNGDDKKKTITVYKVSGKKAVSVFSDTVKGDIFHPSITFTAYRDSSKNCYITVNKEHEGDCRYTTYAFNGKSFDEIAEVRSTAEGEEYTFMSKAVSGDAFNDLVEDIFVKEIKTEIKKSSSKVTNKYIRKMLNSEFDYKCKLGIFDKDIVSCVYSDENGDGIDEMIVREGPISGYILYAYEREDAYDHLIGSTSYSFIDGRVILDGDEKYVEDDGDSYLGLWQDDRCSLRIEKDGDAYVFDIIWGQSADESTEWIYYTVFDGVDSDGNARFSSDLWGRMLELTTDPVTGEQKVETVYENGQADFVIFDGKLTWYDYYKDTTQEDNLMVFEKVD